MKLLILDADGVFLDERPYWEAALAVALGRADIAIPVSHDWQALARAAFDEAALQRVTKDEGCNSNWDLAAVLDRSFQLPNVRGAVLEALTGGQAATAIRRLKAAARGLRVSDLAPALANDPLSRFGIDRRSSGYDAVVTDYQRVLREGIAGQVRRSPLKETLADTTQALEACIRAGYTLRVCTGRRRDEIEAAVAAAGLTSLIPAEMITSATEVEQAEFESGQAPIGKPHWFSPVAAAIGFTEALALLESPAAEPQRNESRDVDRSSDIFYAGDAKADFEAVLGARRMGIPIQYIQVMSPAISPKDLSHMARSPATRGVIDALSGLAPIITRADA